MDKKKNKIEEKILKILKIDNQLHNCPNFNIDKLIQIYIEVEDFIITCRSEFDKIRLNKNNRTIRNRKSSLSESEMMTIIIAFTCLIILILKPYIAYICEFWRDFFQI